MEDLFEREQDILNQALCKLEKGTPCSAADYASLVKEYQKLLKQLRRITKISDKTTIDLNTSKLTLQNKMNYDKLTGIHNRRYLDERLPELLQSTALRRGILSLLMIDVDFFKQYNDTYGHGQGDECLHTVAQAINDCALRAEDFAARYGGEEFIVVLPCTEGPKACVIADRILEKVRNCAIPHEKSSAAGIVTVSIGITAGKVKPSHTMEDYIRSSDKALYLSKGNGRNQRSFIQLEEE